MTTAALQGIGIKTTGVHHVALRSTNLARSKEFYVERLGFPVALETPELLIFIAGQTAIAVKGPADATPPGDSFNPFRVGVDHIALGCADESELHRVAGALAAAGVENTGVKLDTTFNKGYVAFADPDGVKWELYMTD